MVFLGITFFSYLEKTRAIHIRLGYLHAVLYLFVMMISYTQPFCFLLAKDMAAKMANTIARCNTSRVLYKLCIMAQKCAN